ncbi:MAG: DUF1501 domain-containing protein [Planctomycetes bacterium]|nr:DUF1501 domain-containing protein [Planctomycetota bacterium]
MFGCDEYRRLSRRQFLTVGAAGVLTLPQVLQAAERGRASGRSSPPEMNAIFLWLGGGPAHLDLFDPKPEAVAEVRGEFRTIPTSLPGCRVSEVLPHTARQMHRVTLIRSVTHNIGSHAPGSLYLLTGNRPLPSLKYPTYGAVVTKETKAAPDVPPFVAVPFEPGESPGAGYLGVAYNSFSVNADPQAANFSVRAISLPDGTTVERVGRRTSLLHRLDRTFPSSSPLAPGGRGAGGEGDETLAGLDRFQQQAYDIVRSPRARRAFDLGLERASLRQRYGRTTFGQSCLLARRLVEAGCRFVTVNTTGWDTHGQNFKLLNEKLVPPVDQGLSALLEDLEVRGLLASTVVLLVGEFGRTPKINKSAGRDHWPYSMFALLAGGRLPRGMVYGATDAGGERPKDQPVLPDDVAATFYKALNLDPKKEYRSPTGRPIQIIHDGKPIPEILS